MTSVHVDLIENRIKALERLLETLKGQQEHDKERITYVNQLVIDLEKKLEKCICKLENYDNLNKNYLDNHHARLVEITKRLSELEHKNVQSNISCMSAKHAMKVFFEGYKLTRKAWDYDEEDNNNYINLGDNNSVYLDVDDLMADDWYIV